LITAERDKWVLLQAEMKGLLCWKKSAGGSLGLFG
jgi:hypothetical protein